MLPIFEATNGNLAWGLDSPSRENANLADEDSTAGWGAIRPRAREASRAGGHGAILGRVSARTSVAFPAALALASALAAGVLGAAPERHPGPVPAPPVDSGVTSDGVVVLRTPGPAEVLLREGTFTMGSTDAEFAEALAQVDRIAGFRLEAALAP